MTYTSIIRLSVFSILLANFAAVSPAIAQEATTDSTKAPRTCFNFQSTYVYQYKPAFAAQYSGTNSLSKDMEKENSITATLYAGLRLWKGGELYVNPEVAGGSGLSGAYGLAASTNGETFRVGGPEPTLYLARGFVTQTFPIGNNKVSIARVANELGGNKPANFLKFYLGKMSLGDIFDNNQYANSPRTQFMNWCLMNNGAWDYAANLRGYTYAFAAVLQYGNMAYKGALAALPTVANGQDLNTDLSQEFSINAEVDRTFTINKMPGNIRLMGYINDGHMGKYTEALHQLDSSGTPSIIATRQYGRMKKGIVLNADMQLTPSTGVFLRTGWNDGQTETWAFTEADRTLSAGVSINGSSWKRKDDIVALGIVANGLSNNHSTYLANGGLGFQLGDGMLSYSPETAAELYYSIKLPASIWLTGDYQFLLHPGYNKDRGPASVFSLRLHVEL